MYRYILKRIAFALVTLFFIVTITFFLMHAVPGGPFTGEKTLKPEILENLNKKYGLDKPLVVQYGNYLLSLIKLDLGPSYSQIGTSVNEIISRSFPISAKLGGAAVILALLMGIPMGVLAALKRGHWQDRVIMLIATIGIAVPGFVIATVGMIIFGVNLRWLPIVGLKSIKHYILPSISLAFFPAAFIARMMRTSMLEVINQDYIRTARAKGLSSFLVVFKHALKNSILPIVTYIGPLMAGIMTGSFVVEKIFTIPGLGRYFINSITNRDYSVIMGVTIFYGALLIFMTLVVDIIYVFIDPRIKLQK
ncbi:ABC transporter permease [Clostridium thermosuccinogenes]|uniref:ABC transporter permease n=1 Tax=Clostridium thermosuccinogenes TaxID=84032 RepID=UPI000CCC5B38|nr:ABC transporter permease [Pseudoclostridium thermosuccinogenes]PNT91489.1 peptide ABC transporter permease [Pseudoclostridium thermosuccinogenes]